MNSYNNTAEEKANKDINFSTYKPLRGNLNQATGTVSQRLITARIENAFLDCIRELEKQLAAGATITIYDKIGRPDFFKSVKDIPEREIDKAFAELTDYMAKHGVMVRALSPNVTKKELYRFTIEELFNYETEDLKIPGLVQSFVYDSFHPDINYDNTCIAVDYCIGQIFSNDTFEWMHHYQKKRLRLNNLYPLSKKRFEQLITSFKQEFHSFNKLQVGNITCRIEDTFCKVSGSYSVEAQTKGGMRSIKGSWAVEMENQQDTEDWYIHTVKIEGVDF